MTYLIKIGLLLGLFFVSFSIPAQQSDTATFAGGCFWCTQADFDKVPGVIRTIAGYTSGIGINPTYEEVTKGNTGHYEAVQVIYDPNKVSYETLVNYFWLNIDPTDDTGQFCDKGQQYKAVIFFHNEQQKKIALESKEKLIKSGRVKKIVTQILPTKTFYPAEDYHQKYYVKNPLKYRFYRYNCGRDKRLQEIWGIQ